MIEMLNARAILTCDDPGCDKQEECGANITPNPTQRGAMTVKIVYLPRTAKDANGTKMSRLGKRPTDAETWHQVPSALADQGPKWFCPECKIRLGYWPPKPAENVQPLPTKARH